MRPYVEAKMPKWIDEDIHPSDLVSVEVLGSPHKEDTVQEAPALVQKTHSTGNVQDVPLQKTPPKRQQPKRTVKKVAKAQGDPFEMSTLKVQDTVPVPKGPKNAVVRKPLEDTVRVKIPKEKEKSKAAAAIAKLFKKVSISFITFSIFAVFGCFAIRMVQFLNLFFLIHRVRIVKRLRRRHPFRMFHWTFRTFQDMWKTP